MTDEALRARCVKLIDECLFIAWAHQLPPKREAILEKMVSFTREIQQAERERCLQAVRTFCEACGGTGYGQVRYDSHGNFIDGYECEYCGRPIAAIRQEPT